MKKHYLTNLALVIAMIGSSNAYAQSPVLLKDIDAGSGPSNPSSFTDVNGTLFFRAGGGNGNELWKSNGTEAGTVEVANIDPTSNGSASGDYCNVNGTLFFHANDGTHGKELWKSDGTDAGTVLVKDINPGAGDCDLDFFVNVNGTLVFMVTDNTNGTELWRSDGTDAGTFLLLDINPGNEDGVNFNVRTDYGVMNGILYFQGEELTNGDELWKTDGTTAGTVLVKDIKPGDSGSGPEWFEAVNGTMYFGAKDATGYGLWKTDGTSGGTVLVTNLPDPFGFYGGVSQLTNVNGTLFYVCPDQYVNGVELWKSDGTSGGTAMVKDINPGLTDANPGRLVNANGTLFFTADNGTNGVELWKSDGTEAGTVLVKDIGAGSAGILVLEIISINGNVFFVALANGSGTEVWHSDGTIAGTDVYDLVPGGGSSLPSGLTAVGNNLYFSANDGTLGYEPYTLQNVPISIENPSIENALIAFPNPTKGLLNLSKEFKNQTIEILDATGKLVKTETLVGTSLDLSSLPAGMYFGKISGTSNCTFKFVKQ